MSQQFQFVQMPPQNVPFLNRDGTIAMPWYRYLHDLGTITGANTPGIALVGSNTPTIGPTAHSAQFVYKHFVPPTQSQLYVVDQITGVGIGFVNLTNI